MLYFDILREKSPNDPPHVHIGRSPKHGKDSLKLRLDTMKFMPGCTGRYTVDEMREALDLVRKMHDRCMARWVQLHGQPKNRTSSRKTR